MSEKDTKIDLEQVEVDEADEIVELEDEDGNVVPFSWVGTFDHKNETFVVFEPVEPNDEYEEGEAVIFKLETDAEGNDLFTPIEDEEKLNEVFSEFLKIYEAESCDCDGEEGCNCGSECDCKKSK